MTKPSSAEDEWRRFTADLAPCMGDLDEDDVLIISFKNANYFVQFAAQGKFGMRAEAVSNSFLEPLHALSVEDYSRMRGLGWLRATNEPPTPGKTEPADGSPNFYLDLAPPVDLGALAGLATETLRHVYRVRHPGELEYRAFAKGDADIRFPTLRIRRAKV